MDKPTPRYPFKEHPGEVIGKGTFWGESKVMEHGDDWVVKETISPGKNTIETLKENKEDYELFKKWLSDYVPETQFVRGQNDEGKEVNLMRQRRVRGRSLHDIPVNEVMKNERIRAQLADFYSKCIQMWEEVGRIPDLTGMGEPFRSRNLIIQGRNERLFLVDTSAPKNRFSKEAMVFFRLRAQMQIDKMKKFVKSEMEKNPLLKYRREQESVELPGTYDLEQTLAVIDTLEQQLKEGNTTGTGTKREGIRGDIENIMGWHGKSSPQTPLSDEQRVEQLKRLEAAAKSAPQAKSMEKIVSWLQRGIEELKLDQVENAIKDNALISDEKKEQASVIIDQLSKLNERLDELNKILGEDSGIRHGESRLTPEQSAEYTQVNQDIKKKKIELYEFVKKM